MPIFPLFSPEPDSGVVGWKNPSQPEGEAWPRSRGGWSGREGSGVWKKQKPEALSEENPISKL